MLQHRIMHHYTLSTVNLHHKPQLATPIIRTRKLLAPIEKQDENMYKVETIYYLMLLFTIRTIQ